jgi:hypothetical protein
MEKWLRSESLSKLADALLHIFAALAALAFGALMLVILGANPLEAFSALIDGAFGSANALADTDVKALLKTMYHETQKQFAEMGYGPDDLIPLMRGANSKGAVDDVVKIQANVLESWTQKQVVAEDFAKGEGGVIFREVKVSDILSSYDSGFGCLDEAEIVVINKGDYLVEIFG